MSIVNIRAKETGFAHVPEANVRIAYPEMDPPSTALTQIITQSTHCECTLVQALVNQYCQTGIPATIAIGVSKLSCWLCREYISIVRAHYPHLKIEMSSCHGKMTLGWTLPNQSPPEIAGQMYKCVQDCLDEVIARSMKKRRPDSISHTLVTALRDGMEGIEMESDKFGVYW